MIRARRPGLLLVALLAAAAVAVALPGAADAKKKSCAQQVIDDWYGDGRVDGIYPIHCYREAINTLPEDAVVYSSAEADIRRALQARIRKGSSGGGTGASTTGGSSGGGSTGAGPSGTGGTRTGTAGTDTTETTPRGDPNATGGDETNAVGDVDSASSVPVPLLVLGGLAVLLLAAGGAGYLTRRLQARREGGPGEPPPAV